MLVRTKDPSIISWMGSKTTMRNIILSNIPEHTYYIEPFIGSGCIFFAKPLVKMNVINDKDRLLIDWYTCLKEPKLRKRFHKKIECTLFSQAQHLDAYNLIKKARSGEEVDIVDRGWAIWVSVTQSLFSLPNRVWALSNDTTRRGKALNWNKRKQLLFDQNIIKKLEESHLSCRCGIDLLDTLDGSSSMFAFVDPPYVDDKSSISQGYNEKFTMEDLRRLLDVLVKFKGNFMLTHYPQDLIMEYKERHGWHMREHDIHSSHGNLNYNKDGKKAAKRKKECIFTNYKERNVLL